MAETSYLQLPLKQMVNLVVAPDEGLVNFNVLHSVLLVIIQQMDIEGLNVEIHGPQAEKLLAISTYQLTKPEINVKKIIIPPDKDSGKKPEEVVVIEGTGTNDPEPVAITKGQIDHLSKEVEDVKKRVSEISEIPSNLALIDATRGDNETPVISALQLLKLAKRMDATEEGVAKLGALVEEVIKNKNNSATKEKKSRKKEGDETVEEEGTKPQGKKSHGNRPDDESIEEEVVKSQGGKKGRGNKAKGEKSSPSSKQGTKRTSKTQTELESDTRSQTDELPQDDTTTDDQATSSKARGRKKQAQDTVSESEGPGTDERLTSSLDGRTSKTKMGSQGRSSKTGTGNIEEETDRPDKEKKRKVRKHRTEESLSSENQIMGDLANELSELKAKVDEIWESIPKPTEDKPEVVTLSDLFRDVTEIKEKFMKRKSSESGAIETNEPELSELPPDIQLVMIEDRFQEYASQIKRMDITFNDEISKLHNQFTDIEKDFNEILHKLKTGMPAGDGNMDEPNQCCTAVYQKMLQLENELSDLVAMSDKLLDDRDEKEKRINELLENIEHLKAVKADKEDIEEALADKADACAVHRKVSHDKFDTACDELAKGIEDALDKLSHQESLWQHALDEIQIEIGSKLDKMDLGPLREFINNKLRILQERMKTLAALKKEQEAAGTKSKFLRNVNCISCDKDVVMRKDNDLSMRPQPRIVPPARTMGPYLAYELDALRKQQKSLPGSKNLVQLENAMGIIRGGKREEDHVCNRYCGGSHTITTAQQRVTRLGHFLMQWGPEAVPASESKDEAKPMISTVQSVQKQISQHTTTASAHQQLSKSGTGRSSMLKVPAAPPKSPSKISVKQSPSKANSIKASPSAEKKISRSSLKNVSLQDQRDMEDKIIEETPEQLAAISILDAVEPAPVEGTEDAPLLEMEEKLDEEVAQLEEEAEHAE